MTQRKFFYPVTFVVDHCHSTGENRGILCPKCNLGIAHLRDSPEVCRQAADYLEKT